MDDLEGFLAGKPEAVAEAKPEAAPADTPVTPETPAPETPPVDDDPEPASPDGRVPLTALQAERSKRKDYKEQAIRFEEQSKAATTERDAARAEAETLKRQLEEARKAPPPPAPSIVPAPVEQVVQPIPNPLEDPVGFAAYTQRMIDQRFETQWRNQFAERLTASEEKFRRDAPSDVDQAIEAFRTAADVNTALKTAFGKADDPFRWAYNQGRRILALANPEAYEAEVEARLLAKLQTQLPAAAPQPAPVPDLSPSLATARTAAPRTAPLTTGPEPLDSLFPQR